MSPRRFRIPLIAVELGLVVAVLAGGGRGSGEQARAGTTPRTADSSHDDPGRGILFPRRTTSTTWVTAPRW